MAGRTKFQLPGTPRRSICALHNNSHSVTAMLLFFIYFLSRKRAFVWSPAVDLSDPYIAAALAPVTHS
jgi:hypothetical protein